MIHFFGIWKKKKGQKNKLKSLMILSMQNAPAFSHLTLFSHGEGGKFTPE